MGVQGILTIIIIGGIAGSAYYYRDGIKQAFGNTKSQEEKDYDFERKQKEDEQWDKSGWNPDNWGWDNWFGSNSKTETKQESNSNTEIIIPEGNSIDNDTNSVSYNIGNRRFQ